MKLAFSFNEMTLIDVDCRGYHPKVHTKAELSNSYITSFKRSAQIKMFVVYKELVTCAVLSFLWLLLARQRAKPKCSRAKRKFPRPTHRCSRAVLISRQVLRAFRSGAKKFPSGADSSGDRD